MHKGFPNNSGFVVRVKDTKVVKTVLMSKYLSPKFITDQSSEKNTKLKYYCPSDRCGFVCNQDTEQYSDTTESLEEIDLPSCDSNDLTYSDDDDDIQLYKKRKL